MSESSIVNDNIYLLEEIGGDKFSSGVVFRLDSEVIQGFRLDHIRTVDIPP